MHTQWIEVGEGSHLKNRQLVPLVCVDALRPSQKIFSHVGTISCLPGIEQYLSYDVTSEIEIDKPLVVYRLSGNVMTSITTLRT